jgi:hypothetical protein
MRSHRHPARRRHPSIATRVDCVTFYVALIHRTLASKTARVASLESVVAGDVASRRVVRRAASPSVAVCARVARRAVDRAIASDIRV